MVSPIPKWVWKRYAKLWQKFADKPFTFEQAKKELKFLDRNVISVMFNELKTAGWIKVGLNEKDSRFRVYNLINPEQIVESVENDIKKH
ncbi:MAG TPA: hypothetical protein VJ438_06650 [Candidatus Nanoarchaeia archaeon]|nr:hypothetical protein [Candidatus Nanoarchaeia archaeon]